jgi:hypothetical protein
MFKHCYRGKAVVITYTDSEFVALGIQLSMQMHHIVTCGLPSSATFFPHYLTNGTTFGKKKLMK